MEIKPFFSIIIPVYNVEQYLRECLDAVLEQTYVGYEVICVNDGSTDGSLNILLDYKLKYDNLIVLDGVNGGTASARNKGIDAARGEYIAQSREGKISRKAAEDAKEGVRREVMVGLKGYRISE